MSRVGSMLGWLVLGGLILVVSAVWCGLWSRVFFWISGG